MRRARSSIRSPARVPLALNMLMAVGGLGAIMAAGPVGWSLDYVSWRVVFSVAAVLLLLEPVFLRGRGTGRGASHGVGG